MQQVLIPCAVIPKEGGPAACHVVMKHEDIPELDARLASFGFTLMRLVPAVSHGQDIDTTVELVKVWLPPEARRKGQ